MTQSFNCPSCGGTLEYQGTGKTMKCQYCGTVVQVPEEFWREAEQAQTTNQWMKYILIFLAITVGLPTCLALFGTVFGIGSSIFAAILAFTLHFLMR